MCFTSGFQGALAQDLGAYERVSGETDQSPRGTHPALRRIRSIQVVTQGYTEWSRRVSGET